MFKGKKEVKVVTADVTVHLDRDANDPRVLVPLKREAQVVVSLNEE